MLSKNNHQNYFILLLQLLGVISILLALPCEQIKLHQSQRNLLKTEVIDFSFLQINLFVHQ